MKLSIAWIFDHIQTDWKKVDIPQLVNHFNQTTAEIEDFEKITVDLRSFTLGQVVAVHADTVIVRSVEFKQDITLPYRDDAALGQLFLIKKHEDKFGWASIRDLQCNKDGSLPALYCDKQELAGAWKKGFETEDYILEVDNKSITHRPDMWGHRGFAREIAAILQAPLKPLESFLADKPIKQYDSYAEPTKGNPFTIEVKASDLCKRVACFYIEHVERRASLLWMANRLVRVDSRPIDALVDATNYIMRDLGQPMHAFDASSITTKKIVVRRALNKEHVTLLDGKTVDLTGDDCIISDGVKPLSIAGVMGGLETAVTPHTTALLLESGCFDATAIRRTALRFKKRTEASARFEKSLDPNQCQLAILRFLKLLNDAHIPMHEAQDIIVIGKPAHEIEIRVSHDFIEKRIGATIASEFIIKTLERLSFKVSYKDGVYTIIVPTFRCTKDVTIKEDIVEEVGRFFGFTDIPLCLPLRHMKSFDINPVCRVREIKRLLAYALSMHEVCNYSFFDEDFLRQLQWQPVNAPRIKNPVSENWQRLLTSLIPGLLKDIVINKADHNRIRFFEWGRIWEQDTTIVEKKSVAGIFFDQQGSIDFYEAKADLQKLFTLLNCEVRCEKIDEPEQPWYAPYQSAYITVDGTKIGMAGKIDQTLFQNLAQGDAFIFELDGDFLLHYTKPIKRFVPLEKYPGIERDISMLVPAPLSVDELTTLITQASDKIVEVTLLDFFEKEAWKDMRSLTFRFEVRNPDRTMTSEEADAVLDVVVQSLKKLGITIR